MYSAFICHKHVSGCLRRMHGSGFLLLSSVLCKYTYTSFLEPLYFFSMALYELYASAAHVRRYATRLRRVADVNVVIRLRASLRAWPGGVPCSFPSRPLSLCHTSVRSDEHDDHVEPAIHQEGAPRAAEHIQVLRRRQVRLISPFFHGARVTNVCIRSILSQYVLNPYWNWLVTLWPTWVAPNTVRSLVQCMCARALTSEPR
jgi:hypothetical protein